MKNLYIAEKPSVAREFAKALGMKGAATAGARGRILRERGYDRDMVCRTSDHDELSGGL